MDVLEYTKIEVDENIYQKLINGALIDNIYNEEVVLFTHDNKAVALYKTYDKDNSKLKPWKML